MDLKELCRLLKTAQTADEIDTHIEEIMELIPETKIMVGYDQQNHAHQYDLWHHSIHTVLNLPRGLSDDMLYLAALLHDIGKPDCQCSGKTPEDKNRHYMDIPKKAWKSYKRCFQDIACRMTNSVSCVIMCCTMTTISVCGGNICGSICSRFHSTNSRN